LKTKKIEIVHKTDNPNPANEWEYPKHWFAKIPVPLSLTWGRWDHWEADVKGRYPIRYFIQRTIPDSFDTIRSKLRDAMWYILHRIHPKHRYHMVDSGLKPGYYDPDTLMMHSAFKLLSDFINSSIKDQIIDWDADESHQKAWIELMALNTWWVYERPDREDKFDRTHEWPDIEPLSVFDKETQNDPNVIQYRKISEQYSEAREKWHKEDEEMFIRLIKIRRYLWYP